AAGVNGCQGLNLFVDTRTLTTQFFNMWHFISLFLDIKKAACWLLKVTRFMVAPGYILVCRSIAAACI
ncbi:hypothetical protein ACSNNQ_28480, partial [Klebsiella pneumoniae]|nr:hypothetical protein [Klebsiella pneumoniae]